MAREKIEKMDVYLLAAIAIFSLLLIAVELMPIPTEVVTEQPPSRPAFYRSGVRAVVNIPAAPSPASTMATVTVV